VPQRIPKAELSRPTSVGFRVDAAGHIGIGHYMRCLSLADALATCGAQVRFFSRHLTEHLRQVLAERGYALEELTRPSMDGEGDLPHSAWLDTSQAADADEFVERARTSLDWVVVDHYALDARWERAVRSRAAAVLAIDDLADRQHDSDLLLDQNLYCDLATRYRVRVSDSCRMLLGPSYALLRPEFAALRGRTKPRDGSVRNVLVTLGGADARNLTLKALNALRAVGMEGRRVDVIIGAAHTARCAVEEFCAAAGFHCHVQPSAIAGLMAVADLAIGAAGSTSWERCCLGVPTVCITDGHNQVPIAEGLAAHGAVVNLGDGGVLEEARLARELAALLADEQRIRSISQAAHSLVDGLGTHRVRSALEVT
jgi:UDP-2,4-diacetamido-2,4,6-trideoxy-beta-L-altropyranose hydrolase